MSLHAMRQWISLRDRLPEYTKGAAVPVLLYNAALAVDPDFPGHAYVVSNPEFVASGNAAHSGYTHWLPIHPFDGAPHNG